MEYYRRNPLNGDIEGTAKQVSETVAGLTPARYVPAPVENLLSILPASVANSASADLPVSALPFSSLPSTGMPIQNAAELVQKAIEILDKEMAAGMLAAQQVYSPTLPFSIPAPASTPLSIPISTQASVPTVPSWLANTFLPTSLPMSATNFAAVPMSAPGVGSVSPPAAKPGAASSTPTDLLSLLYSIPTQGASLPLLNGIYGTNGLGSMPPQMAEELIRNVQRLVTSFTNLMVESQKNAMLVADVVGDRGMNNANETRDDEDSVPLLRPKRAVSAGESAVIALRVENETALPTLARFQCADLIAHTGYRVPSLRIEISPREAALAPGEVVNVTLTIAVPLATPAGTYSGLLTVPTLSYLHAVVLLTVV